MNPQPPAAPAAAEEIAALRDALSKATPGEWATGKGVRPMYAGDTQIVGVNDDGDVFILASFNHNFDVSKANAAFLALTHNLAPKLLAALDVAEAQAVEFAWDALAFAGVCVNSESGIYNDCANSSAESAAEYLAERGLLKRMGERTWQRVEGI
jgi:hypothetical protein